MNELSQGDEQPSTALTGLPGGRYRTLCRASTGKWRRADHRWRVGAKIFILIETFFCKFFATWCYYSAHPEKTMINSEA
jgi:hypothetical protein